MTLVGLDPMTRAFTATTPCWRRLNGAALQELKLHIVNTDAFQWLQRCLRRTFDVIVVDFPDPTNFSIGKLYTTAFMRCWTNGWPASGFRGGANHFAAGGTQSERTVVQTIESVGLDGAAPRP